MMTNSKVCCHDVLCAGVECLFAVHSLNTAIKLPPNLTHSYKYHSTEKRTVLLSGLTKTPHSLYFFFFNFSQSFYKGSFTVHTAYKEKHS